VDVNTCSRQDRGAEERFSFPICRKGEIVKSVASIISYSGWPMRRSIRRWVPPLSKLRPRRNSALRAAQPERHTEADGNGAAGMCIRAADECGVVREQINARKRVEEAAAGPPIIVA